MLFVFLFILELNIQREGCYVCLCVLRDFQSLTPWQLSFFLGLVFGVILSIQVFGKPHVLVRLGHHCDQMPDKKQLDRGGRIYFGSELGLLSTFSEEGWL